MKHVYLAFKGVVLGYFLTNGFYSFSDLIYAEQNINPFFWWGEPSNKIMSGLGALLYEVGLPALVLPMVSIFLTLKTRARWPAFVLFFLAPIIVYSNALSFANPYFSILIAAVVFEGMRTRKSKPFVPVRKLRVGEVQHDAS